MKSHFEGSSMGRPRIYTSEKMETPYKLELIGQGQENLVYEAKGYPGVVLKGSKVILAETIAWNIAHGLPPEADSPHIQELREGKLIETRAAYQNLRKFFGNHVLPQKQLLMEVPFNTAVLHGLKRYAKDDDHQIPTEGTGTGWTIVTIQKKTEVLNDYRLLSLRGHPYLTDLLHRASTDAGLAEVLADFQRRAVQHANSTQDILDVVGRDNIVFNQTDTGSWNYTLIDAIHPFVKPRALEKTRLALAGQDRGEATPVDMRDTLLDTWNYITIINIIGKELGTNMRIELDDSTFLKRAIEEWRALEIKNVREQSETLKKMGYSSSNKEVEAAIQLMERMSKRDLLLKMANNLPSWFPGGMYREDGAYYADIQASLDAESKARTASMTKEIDSVLDQNNLQEIAKRMAALDQTLTPEERLTVISPVVVRLLRQGYVLKEFST